MDVEPTEFRHPLPARILQTVFLGGIDCAVLVGVIVQGGANGNAGPTVLALLFFAGVAALGWRIVRLAAIIDGEELLVRNLWLNHHIRRSEVLRLGYGKTPTKNQFVETIVIGTTSGPVPIDVLTRYTSSMRSLPLASYSNRRSESAMLVLSAWAHRTPAQSFLLS